MRSIHSSVVRMIMAAFAVGLVMALIVVWLNPSEADSNAGAPASQSSAAGFSSGFAPGFAAADPDLPEPTAEQSEALAEDLAAAAKLEGKARAKALKAIREKARAGEYGAAFERGSGRVMGHGKHHDKMKGGFAGAFGQGKHAELVAAMIAFLPPALQDDLKAAQAAPAGERAAKYKAIMDKALAGGYGAEVTELAKQLQGLRGR